MNALPALSCAALLLGLAATVPAQVPEGCISAIVSPEAILPLHMGNPYFELTEEFNAERLVAVLASGQATVWHRIAIMSKDGDWILGETAAACARVLDVLGGHGARYRPGAPLHVDWLSGGWSSHFEFLDSKRRRLRCDFFSRPPRLMAESVKRIRENPEGRAGLPVIGIEPLIAMKQTQRAKDYAVITELARRLEPERELAFTWDADRIMELAPTAGSSVDREAVRLAREGGGRQSVVMSLAREADRLQQADKARLNVYAEASAPYIRAFRSKGIGDLTLERAHAAALELARELLPTRIELPPCEA